MAFVWMFRCVTRKEAVTDFPQPGSADSQRRPDGCFPNQSLYLGCSVTQAHVPSAGFRTRRRWDWYFDVYKHLKISEQLRGKFVLPWYLVVLPELVLPGFLLPEFLVPECLLPEWVLTEGLLPGCLLL